ncbi:MAG: type II secretion system protein GspL [Pseudomonadota bacterium]
MTTLYIRHPARVDSEGALVQFALVADGGNLMQQGEGALRSLGDLLAASGHVVLLLAAADVTLLQVKAPPLSAARLKAALPSLVEEQVLGDPADCVLMAAPTDSADGTRMVAVAQRGWLEMLVKAVLALGARTVAALPAQLCLPLQPGSVTGAIDGAGITLRHGQYQGLGLAMAAEPAAALQAARALAGESPLLLYVAPEQLEQYRALAGPGVTLEAAHWAHWIAGSKSTSMDLVPALGAAGAKARDWQRWRWPLRLALLAVLVNLVGLNLEWMRMKREAEAIRLGMLQTFKAAYPKEQVILDPAAQMRKNIALAKLAGGQLGADEFNYMAAAFGEALRALPRQPALAGLEYRERALTIKLKPDTVDPAMLAQLKGPLAVRKLGLEQAAASSWLLRNTGGQP